MSTEDDIRQGLYDYHLGHIFPARLVFASLDGGILRLLYRFTINLKKFWWNVKRPYQRLTHRDCPTCIKFRRKK